jgi:hypothetical protein
MQQSVALQAAPEHSRRWSDPLFILVVELNALHAASSKAESTRAVLPLLHVRGMHSTVVKVPLDSHVTVPDFEAAVPET